MNSISKNIGIDKLNVIVEKYPQLSLEWLITGKGEMLKSTLPTTKTNKLLMPKVVVVDDKDNERVTSLVTTILPLLNHYPLTACQI